MSEPSESELREQNADLLRVIERLREIRAEQDVTIARLRRERNEARDSEDAP